MKIRTLITLANSMMLIVASSVFAQTTLPSTITVDTRLGPNGNPADTEYLINGTLHVYGTDGEDQLTTLTIEPGVTIRFAKSASSILQIGEGSSPGSLKVNGTEAEPVLFTSAAVTPAPGDWRYINLTSLARECVIDHAIVEYGGLSQGYGFDGTLLNAADSLLLTNSTIRLSGRHGLILMSGAKKIRLENNSLVDNNMNGLYSYNASNFSISINGGRFLSNGSYGLNIQQDANISLTNSLFDPNTAGAMILNPNNVGGIDSSNSFTAPGLIEVISGNITRFAFWPGFFSDYGVWYYINSAIKVYGSAESPTTLHIGEGAELRFAKGAGSWLQVGENSNAGNLIVSGTAQKPVTFTSSAAQPAKGDWRFIYLTSVAKKCIFDHTNIVYAGLSQGYGDDCALKSDADTLIMTSSSVSNSNRHGIALRSNTNFVSLDDVELANNANNGLVTIDGSGYTLRITNGRILSNSLYGLNIQHNIDFSVETSTFDANTSGIMLLNPDIVGGIDPLTTFTEKGRIEVISGNVTRDAFWPGFFSNDSVYYYINNAIKVYGIGESPTTLHIGEGAELRFAKDAGSWLQVGESSNTGNLIVTGTAERPVTFTSVAVQPAKGDWRFINLIASARKCTFDHTSILYAGLSQGYGDDCALKSDADTLIMTNSSVSNSNRHGILFRASTQYVSLDNVSVESNANNGIVTYDGSGYDLLISNSSFLSNGYYGLNIRHNIDFSIKNSTFDANTSGAMLLNPNIVGGVENTNSFKHKGLIEVISGNVTRDAFWPGFFSNDSVYYFINNAITVYGSDASPTTLHIGEGAELRFAKGAGSWMQIGEGNNLGTLLATGTADKPVTFTSAAAQPANGDWRFVFLTSRSVDCILDHVNMTFGGLSQGYGSDATLRIESSSPSITNSTISHSGIKGIYINGTSSPYTYNNTFTENNSHGVYATGMSNDMDFSFNNFMLNTGSGCLNDDATDWVDASYSYWGSEDGPSGIGPGTGDEATGQVIIDPWLSGPVTPMLDLTADTDSLTYEACTAVVHVTTGLRWVVSTEQDWITFDTMQGTKIDSFRVNFTENPSADLRTAFINVTSGDTLTRTIEITQPGAPPVFSHNAPAEITAQAGMVDLAIHTNFTWSLSADCDWIFPSPTEGYFDGIVTLNYSENTTYEPRSCNLTITGGGITEVIILTQQQSTVGTFNGRLQDHIYIYPNPVVEGTLYIRMGEPYLHQERSYSVINTLGQLMVSGKLMDKTNQLDASGLAEGVYMLRISDESGEFYDWVIVVRR